MKLSFRDAVPEDWDAIKKLHVEQQAKQGSHFELPFLFGWPFPVVHVGVDKNGVIRSCRYCEAVPEMRFIGIDPRATAQAQRDADGFCYVLKLKGFRELSCCVPREAEAGSCPTCKQPLPGKLVKAISKPLIRAKFRCIDKEQSLFSRDLR